MLVNMKRVLGPAGIYSFGDGEVSAKNVQRPRCAADIAISCPGCPWYYGCRRHNS